MKAADSGAPVRVAFFPPPKRRDPAGFLALLSDAVEQAGAERVDTGPLGLRFSLTQTRAEVIHLHWLEYVATPDPAPFTGWLRTWLRLGRLVTGLSILRLRGVGIVWTVHNLAPHEPARPRAEAALSRAVYRLADEVIVHSEYARRRVLSQFRGRRRRELHVIPHPNYLGAFPAESRDRDELRAALDIPSDAFVYLAFGIIRRYKRLGLLAERFRELEGDDLRLVVAGAPSQPDEAALVRAHASADHRIILRDEYVPDDCVAGLHLAADAAVIAYADVFSSGALLLALSYGVPVVAPSGGTGAELFGAPAVEFFDGDDLGPALERVRSGHRAEAARAAAERFPWSRAGAATVDVYRVARRRS